ncbi:hypothetical protein Tco_0740929 [Tanacetum coccineum]
MIDDELSLHDELILDGTEPIMRSESLFQNGTQRSESTKGKDGLYMILPPSTQANKFADEKEKETNTTALLGLCCDEVIHSFLATNADDVDLIHEDLDQIDDLDLEEMDINWQIAMTAIKIKKFYKKTGRRPRVDGKMHVAFDKRKVEVFHCHNTGHLLVSASFKGTKDGSRQEASNVKISSHETERKPLMTIDEGQINWVEQTTDEEINHCF